MQACGFFATKIYNRFTTKLQILYVSYFSIIASKNTETQSIIIVKILCICYNNDKNL